MLTAICHCWSLGASPCFQIPFTLSSPISGPSIGVSELSGGFCFLWELQVTLFFSEDPCMLAQSCRYTRVAGLLGSQAALGAFCH